MINSHKRYVVVGMLLITLVVVPILYLLLFDSTVKTRMSVWRWSRVRKGECLYNRAEYPGAINIYFNKSAYTAYALPGNRANYHVNLERRLIRRIRLAQKSIDGAVYEINLPRIVNELIDRAASGVHVRLIVDAKRVSSDHYRERWKKMRVFIEKLKRGKDEQFNTADDIMLLADSPVFAVTDPLYRKRFGLPPIGSSLPKRRLRIGRKYHNGHILVWGEQKKNGDYYSPGAQMHNKFFIFDRKWVWTGSWNFTVTGLYGSQRNYRAGKTDGNAQHSLEIHSATLASIFRSEFREMWGGKGRFPRPRHAAFHGRKRANTPLQCRIGGRRVDVWFSPGDRAVDRLTECVRQSARESVHFLIFAWSDQRLCDVIKEKWEGEVRDRHGRLTGFTVRGVFDASFWDQWWSASINMTGRTVYRESRGNPNRRWYYRAPVFPDREYRKLHAKTMIIDANGKQPMVATGSTNWSRNGQRVNDENMLVIHDRAIVNQFMQEFWARYHRAGGKLPAPVLYDPDNETTAVE